MSHILFTPYADDYSVFSAAEMNKPLENFDEALVYMKNIIVTCDGDIAANRVDGRFSFTGNLRILFTSPIDGRLIENIVAPAVVAMEAGECLYVDLSDVNGTTLKLQKVQLSANQISAMRANRILVAYRNKATGEISLANTLHKIVSGGGQSAERVVPLAENVVVSEGQMLYLNSQGKYAPADNVSLETTQDLVMVKAMGVEDATVMEAGVMTVAGDFAVGAPLYLGTAGNIAQTMPEGAGRIVKCIGYAAAGNLIKFKPDTLGIELL